VAKRERSPSPPPHEEASLYKLFIMDGLRRTQERAVMDRAFIVYSPDKPLGGALLQPPTAFEHIHVGGVYPFTLRYFKGFIPPQPKQHDTFQALFKGGHAQPCVFVGPAIVTHRISADQIEIRLPESLMLSHGSGPCCRLYHWVLNKDGTVGYWLNHRDNDALPTDYVNNTVGKYHTPELCPRWEFTAFPVLPSVVHGV
jgi:hypothetical protein